MHVFYLHGFMSSALSSKARFFADKLARLGLPLHCPDFNEPDFSTLTPTRMVQQVRDAIAALPPEPVVLIGSSLGAFVAWHVAASPAAAPPRNEHPAAPPRNHVSHLVLLAPALEFGVDGMSVLGETGLRHWKETGWHEFFHFAYDEPRRVHYGLYEDAQRYDSGAARVHVPTLVFQGTRDALVNPAMVRRFVSGRDAITLHELDDDHQLHASLDVIWTRTAAFLGLPPE